ncbi:hypothetical protein ACHWQZ_G014788 [Mnemiopsis leidyi]
MSQGYGYAPPTLEEAIKSYQKAKEKAALIEKYGKVNSKNYSRYGSKNNDLLLRRHLVQQRRRGYSQGSISEINDSDENSTSDDYPKRKNKNMRKVFKHREPHLHNNALVSHQSIPAWSHPYPVNSFHQYNPFINAYPNMPAHPSLPGPGLPGPYMNSFMPSLPYFYPQPPLGQGVPNYHLNNPSHPYSTQYNARPAEPMDQHDFQRDCKYSPVPSRPYSDSDLLETLSKHTLRDSDRFTIIPPIKSMDRNTAAKVIQRNYRGYKEKTVSGAIREKFFSDYINKLIDDLLVEELLPDILVEVLLYGTKDIKLPSVTERVVCEFSEQVLDECVYDMLRTTANSVLSEILNIYAGKRDSRNATDMMVYIIDELIMLQIRDVVQEFLREYIVDFQCKRVFNQLVYETTSVLVCEVLKEDYPDEEEDVLPKKGKPPFDLDNIILASVLCKSLVPNEDYILDGVIAQGLANQLKLGSK